MRKILLCNYLTARKVQYVALIKKKEVNLQRNIEIFDARVCMIKTFNKFTLIPFVGYLRVNDPTLRRIHFLMVRYRYELKRRTGQLWPTECRLDLNRNFVTDTRLHPAVGMDTVALNDLCQIELEFVLQQGFENSAFKLRTSCIASGVNFDLLWARHAKAAAKGSYVAYCNLSL